MAEPSVKAGTTSQYLEQRVLDFKSLVSTPPASGSGQAVDDLATLHRLQSGRTLGEIKAAQRDDRDESIFIFDTVLGSGFVAPSFPLTAALSQHLRQEAGFVTASMKTNFHRVRPFIADPTLTPVCERTSSNSYPSGHALVGYLESFALAQLLPEKADAIFQRADDYARNRVICGVHYPTDVTASHTIAAALFGSLATSPRFQKELVAARAEVRKQLALQP